MALSSAVVAVCALVVTVKVLTLGPVSVERARVLDQTALEKQVATEAGQVKRIPDARVVCPLSVVVKEGTKFDCRVYGGTNPETVFVEITSDQGDLSMELGS
ncbi:protein of unknown function [Actinacidiphila glaucinigra]|uniref:DUF4333 domain-containing protein n=2 Tax=Actinacidiphila glaucinigra TaxID=235986 RepID=A0A239NDE5_9ACTN|nr:protein of unknown function [Actinacidiphila glaucinigra]